MHTEIEAKDLWCPLVRHEGESAGSFNRGWSPSNPLNCATTTDEESYLCNCIGSRCSAWRWSRPPPSAEAPVQDQRIAKEPRRADGLSSRLLFLSSLRRSTVEIQSPPDRRQANTGYCGMVGHTMNPRLSN